MSISLWLEAPAGVRTARSEFLPGEPVRFAGKVWLLLPEPWVTVTITLKDRLGTVRDQWLVRANWAGVYWADVYLPQAGGTYTVQAAWAPPIGAPEASRALSFTVTAVPSTVGDVVEFSLVPEAVQLQGSVKAICSVYLDGRPEAGVPVEFWVWDPSPIVVMAGDRVLTDSRGIAYREFNPDKLGRWRVVINVPKYNRGQFFWLDVLAQEPLPQPPPAQKRPVNIPLLVGGAAAIVGGVLLLVPRGRRR